MQLCQLTNTFDRDTVIGEGRRERIMYHQSIGSVSFSSNNEIQQSSPQTEIESNVFRSSHSLLQWESLAQDIMRPQVIHNITI